MVKYFLVLQPFPGYGLIALAAVTAFAVESTTVSAREMDSGLGLILFVQMFLASSGFVVSAHRGHYDPVLGHDADRSAALAAQWCASVLPGFVCWMTVAAAAYLSGGQFALSAAAGSRLAAFFIVSSLAWCAGFVLPRGGAGVIWAGVLVFLLLRHVDLVTYAAASTSTAGVATTAAVLLVCPFLLLGTRGIDTGPILGASAIALTVLLVTWRAGTAMDVYLVERS